MAQEFDSTSSRAGSDRVPPHSMEAERGVLGSILLDAARVMDLCVERQIRPDSFYVPAHRKVYQCLHEMSENGDVIDGLTAADRLRSRGLIDGIGGGIYLDELIDSTPTSAHAEFYIDIVRQKDLLRRVIDCARRAENRCYDSEESADIILDRTEQAFLDITQTEHGAMTSWPDAVMRTMEHVEHILATGRGLSGVSTGYANLDYVMHGLRPGEMIVLAARPSMGKTSLAMNIAERIALGSHDVDHKPRPVGVFSLEMSAETLVLRMLCAHSRVRSDQLSQGFLSQANHRKLTVAASALGKAPILVDDTGGLDIMELRARARRMKKKADIELIVVDYLQLLNSSEYSRQGRQLETANISNSIKAMAKELRVPVLVLSQLSRAPEQRDKLGKPKLSDLRDSGAIEQDADVVCMLRRPCRYPDDDEYEDKTLAIVDIAKHRNGPTGEVRLNFQEEYTAFEDRDTGHGVDGIPEMGEALVEIDDMGQM